MPPFLLTYSSVEDWTVRAGIFETFITRLTRYETRRRRPHDHRPGGDRR